MVETQTIRFLLVSREWLFYGVRTLKITANAFPERGPSVNHAWAQDDATACGRREIYRRNR
jgi:hypothetical protein